MFYKVSNPKFSIKFSGGIQVHDPYNILRGRVNFLNKFLRVDRSGRGLWHKEMIKVTGENYLFMGDQGSPKLGPLESLAITTATPKTIPSKK